MDYCVPVYDSPVPNVPCGVESGGGSQSSLSTSLFLMYRVELKALTRGMRPWRAGRFLMYRVELKAQGGVGLTNKGGCS